MSSVLVPMADGPPSPDRPTPLRALPSARPTDAELIAASVGDPEQFAALFDRHAPAVHRYLGRRVGDLADDLLSETFLIAFRRRAAYRPEHVEVRPWLLGIATDVVHGHARTERRRYRALARSGAEHAAPAGAEEMGRVLTPVNDEFEQQTVTVHVPLPEDVAPLDAVRASIEGPVGPQLDVTVKGRPAALVRTDHGPGHGGWILQAQFEDGTADTLQVPDAFTQEQVVEFAEAVTRQP